MHCKNHQRGTESSVGIRDTQIVAVADDVTIRVNAARTDVVVAEVWRAKVKNFIGVNAIP